MDHWVGSDIGPAGANGAGIGTVNDTIKCQQRILRRLLTNPGEYKWHPTYGAGVLKYVGSRDSSLKALEGLILSQIQLERGVAQYPAPTVVFVKEGEYLTASIEYTEQDSNSRQFLSFTVTI